MSNTFWQLYSHVYDFVRFLPPYQQMLNDARNAADIHDSHKVLDAGCGTGNFISHMCEHNSQAEYVGGDISPVMLSQASAKNRSNSVQFIHLDLNKKLPFDNASFDRIIALNSLYAVKDLDFSIGELLRVLKSKGKLVFVNPDDSAGFFSTYRKIISSGQGLARLKLFFLTSPLFFFNLLIKMQATKSVYHFISTEAWLKILHRKPEISTINHSPTYIESQLFTISKK